MCFLLKFQFHNSRELQLNPVLYSNAVIIEIKKIYLYQRHYLNSKTFPDKCFDVCECGDNVLSFLPELNNGMVFWPIPVLIDVDRPCNIIVGKRHFTTVADFTEGVRAIYDENNQYK